jgi:hypothetical protein
VGHVETLFFRAIKRQPQESLPLVNATAGSGHHRRILGVEELERALRQAIPFRSKKAELLFRSAVLGQTRLNLATVAEQLRWPAAAVRTMYRKLEFRGEPLPPLVNGTSVVKVQMTCPRCHRIRFLSPRVAVRLHTDTCFDCLHLPPVPKPKRLAAVCPRCGLCRLLTPLQVKQRSAGLETLCRLCSMAKARSRRWAEPIRTLWESGQ